MPRFYFDIRERTSFLPDGEGLELPGLDTAERMAAETAAAIGRDALSRSDCREVTIEVRNQYGQRVLIVAVSMQVDRVVPEPLSRRGSSSI